MRAKRVGVPWLALVLLWPLAVADAACPQNVCDCLGQAAKFSVVASLGLTIKPGRAGPLGYRYETGAYTDSVCAPTARISGTYDAPSNILADLMLLAGPGTVAGRFRTVRGDGEVGVSVSDTLATGGGTLVGDVDAATIDTTGTHPRLPSCQQAIADMESASAALAALTPTMDLGKLTLSKDDLEIPVGSGVQVLSATAISLRPRSYGGYRSGPTLEIDRQQDTDIVILNTPSLHVGYGGTIRNVDIINVPGRGGAVALGTDANVWPILAPQRRITAKATGDNGLLIGLFGQRITMRGSGVQSYLDSVCP